MHQVFQERYAGVHDAPRAVRGDGGGEIVVEVGAIDLVAAFGIGGGGGDVADVAVCVTQVHGMVKRRAFLHRLCKLDENLTGAADQGHVADAERLHFEFHSTAVYERRRPVAEGRGTPT